MGPEKDNQFEFIPTFAAICPIKWKSGLMFCMLHRAKLICSSDSLFFRKADILKSLFSSNSYPAHFFDEILRKFLTLSSHHTSFIHYSEGCFFEVTCINPASKQFTKSLSEPVYREFGLKLRVIYDTIMIIDQSLLSAENKNTACSLLQCRVPVSMFA